MTGFAIRSENRTEAELARATDIAMQNIFSMANLHGGHVGLKQLMGFNDNIRDIFCHIVSFRPSVNAFGVCMSRGVSTEEQEIRRHLHALFCTHTTGVGSDDDTSRIAEGVVVSEPFVLGSPFPEKFITRRTSDPTIKTMLYIATKAERTCFDDRTNMHHTMSAAEQLPRVFAFPRRCTYTCTVQDGMRFGFADATESNQAILALADENKTRHKRSLNMFEAARALTSAVVMQVVSETLVHQRQLGLWD